MSKTLADLELGALRGLSTSTDLKAVLAEKIPAEQVGFLNLDFYLARPMS